MLNQIVSARAICLDIRDQLAHHVQLVVAGEDQLITLQADELLNDVHHAVRLENLLPQVIRGIPIRVGRVALAAVVTGAVAALVEGQEEGLVSGELRGHPRLVQVNTEERQDALVELEADFTRVAVGLPLLLGVFHILAGELVLQLKGKHGNTVDRQQHIHRVIVHRAVMPLADAMEDVLLIVGGIGFIQGGFRHEVAHPEGNAPVLEAVAQHIQHAHHIAGIVERDAELALRVDGIHADKALPGLGLGGLHKADQGGGVQAQLRVEGIVAMGVAARGRQEEGLNIALKALFGRIGYGHAGTSFLPVTYS